MAGARERASHGRIAVRSLCESLSDLYLRGRIAVRSLRESFSDLYLRGRIAALNGSPLLFSREEGGEGREKCMDTLQWASVMNRTAESPCEARQRAPATHYLLPSSPF